MHDNGITIDIQIKQYKLLAVLVNYLCGSLKLSWAGQNEAISNSVLLGHFRHQQ
jgi:hypothetical protein